MKRLRVYLDTSVIGGCFDPEFTLASRRLIKAVERGIFIAVISNGTRRELQEAPVRVQQILQGLPENCVEGVEETPEAIALARAYLAARVVRKGDEADALHIATATVHRVDVVVSWNFKHIVNLSRIRGYNAVNLAQGYGPVEIRSPWEVQDVD